MQRQSVKIRMTSSDDLKWTIPRDKLLGASAAEKFGIAGRDAEAYSDAFAMGSLDPAQRRARKNRKDFDAAGVVQWDEQILRVMNGSCLKPGAKCK